MSKEEILEESFIVQCNCCGTQYENWVGSTPCCGSIAYIVENGQVTGSFVLYARTTETNNQRPKQ